MLGSKMVYNIFAAARTHCKSIYYCLKHFPNWYKNNLIVAREYVIDFKRKLSNLTETNINLGIYHLRKHNFIDAIIRFKLVGKFFSPGNQTANYWLGWCYFMQNKCQQAISHLQQLSTVEAQQLKSLLENWSQCSEMPEEIWRQCRELCAERYTTSFHNDKVHLPYSFANRVLEKITNLPSHYRVLDLGSNVGLIGYEIKKRFPDSFDLVGVESSPTMNKLVSIYYPNRNIYSQILNCSIKEFIDKKAENKFDIILSFCSLSFTNKLEEYFKALWNLLQDNGYFAVCLPSNNLTKLSLKHKEFVFNPQEVKNSLLLCNFSLLGIDELTIGVDNKYCIFICQKESPKPI